MTDDNAPVWVWESLWWDQVGELCWTFGTPPQSLGAPMHSPCPAWLLIGSSPEPHDCHLTKGHDGPHSCRCDMEWSD